MTAAHCVVDDNGLNISPLLLQIQAGASQFDFNVLGAPPVPQPGDDPQVRGVTVSRVHPGYPRPLGGGSTLPDYIDDVAVLTLNAPLTVGPAVGVLPLTARNVVAPVGANGSVTGYGLQVETPPARDGRLFELGEVVQDGSLDPAITGGLNALFVTGISPAGSFCSGDSGGPLQLGGTLVGTVSTSPACRAGAPNIYPYVSAGEIRDFIEGDDTPPLAPRGGQDVTLTLAAAGRPPRQGDNLACSAGTWSNSPTFTYAFTDSRDGRVLQSGPSATYTVTGVSDAGATISCRAIASNDGGVGRTPPTQSAPGVTAAPPPPPPPPPTVDDDLSLSVTASKTRVRRADRVTFTLTLRNRGERALTGVSQCARLSSRYTVVSRGGGKVSSGRICFRAKSSLAIGGKLRSRYTVRIDRDARLGRFIQTARANSSQRVADDGRRTISILPAARRPSPKPPPFTG